MYPQIDSLTDCQASQAANKRKIYAQEENFTYLCSTKRTVIICTGCAST